MPTNNPTEEEDANENDIESITSSNQQVVPARNRPHLSRASGKETAEDSDLEISTVTNANLLTNQRSSNRLNKRLRRDTSPVDAILKKAVAIKPNTSSIGSKTRRPWELWSVEDKNAFFEALCEYGKDFESIQSHIAQRSKKKGISANMIKNKDQVRHFYYRTWHKISKFLEISECVRKQTQELYGLINYAELRKKIGGLSEKNSQKLNELVFSGVTTVKHKGKKLRIKTPVCRALKKLNNVSDTKEPETDKMPKDIVVEFRPHTNLAWHQVQNLSQNPRIRTKVNLQKRLRPVLEYFQRRWRPIRLKRKEQMMTSLPPSATEEILCDPSPVLRIKPGRDVKISLLSLSAMDIASSSDVCLQKYLKYAQKTLFGDEMAKAKKPRLKPKVLVDRSVMVDAIAQKLHLIDETTSFDFMENILLKDSTEISKSSFKLSSDENNCVGILTPPKSVPEHEACSDHSLNEAQRSLSLLSSMLSSANIKNLVNSCEEAEKFLPLLSLVQNTATITNPSDSCEEVDNKSDESTENQISLLSENKINEEMTSSVLDDICEKLDNFSCIQTEENQAAHTYSNQQDSEVCETMTLSQLLNKNCDIPEPSLDSTQCNDEHENDISGSINFSKFSKDDEVTFCNVVKQGWTAEEAGFLTFGELYLMFGNPSKIILEYEFEQSETVEGNNLSEKDDEASNLPAEMSNILENVFRYACSVLADDKNKQLPPSPTSKNIITRINTATQTPGKQILRNAIKSPNLKTNLKMKNCNLNETISMDPELSPLLKENIIVPESVSNFSKPVANTTEGTGNSSDKHVFVMPVGTAPRNVKLPNQESLREEIGKLLPGTRRGCRVRRKPLVVQRPLLPRDGMRTISGPRPMTVVHFVPSGSQLTAVIPSSCTGAENKISLPSANKVVKILSTGPPIDMHPLQVPVMKQVCSDPGKSIILQPSSIATPHVIINPTQREPSMIDSHHSVSDITLSSGTVNSLNIDMLSSSGCEDSESASPIPSLESAISISDVSDNLSSNLSSIAVSSFLKIPLSEGFKLSAIKDKSPVSSPPATPCLDSDPAFSSKQNTPPDSPPHQPFRINSPEIQWLNGEGAELSLNTFLNAMESPCKTASSSTSVNLATENSNLDPIVRLAPVVDSQVRCLLDECSIDFITKFEDLADVINSSSSDSKPT